MRNRIVLALSLGFITALGTAASSREAAASPPQATAPAAAHGKSAGSHLPWLPFPQAVMQLNLTSEQRAQVERIHRDFEAQTQPNRAAAKALAEQIAKGIADGKLDRAAVDAQTDALVRGVQSSQAAMQDAAQKLHDLLTGEQRKELVERLQHGHRGGHGFEGGAPVDRMHELADELKLTPEQRQALRRALKNEWPNKGADAQKDRAAMREHWQALGGAFVADRFDARAAGVGKYSPEMAGLWAKRFASFADAANGILRPEQRAQLAEKIRARSAHIAL